MLALAFLLPISACQVNGVTQSAPIIAPSPTFHSTQGLTPLSTGNPSQRNHVHFSTLFVSVTFTASTTYEQAVATFKAVGENLYPWNCDDPRTPIPPAVSEQRTAFSSSHVLFISYPDLPKLDELAASPQVLSIDPQPLYMCP